MDKKILGAGSVVVIVCLVFVEMLARSYGFGNPPLYEKTSYGYKLKPNQDLMRLKHHFFINDQSLRSGSVAARPSNTTIRILCLGDSITNGGVLTDQSQTYPYLLQGNLNRKVNGGRFEVLNASAAGWAIENEEGFLKAQGMYHSRLVILQLGTEDLYQGPSPSETVDNHPGFPSHKPAFALAEIVFRYLLPRFSSQWHALDPGVERTRPKIHDLQLMLASLNRINRYVVSQHGKLLVFLIEQPRVLEPRDKLTEQAKKALVGEVRAAHIPFVNITNAFPLLQKQMFFRDGVHPTEKGNALLAADLVDLVDRELPVRP